MGIEIGNQYYMILLVWRNNDMFFYVQIMDILYYKIIVLQRWFKMISE
jgi:hypothetical protein